MRGFLVRLSLFLKLWFTSKYLFMTLLLMVMSGVVIYNSGSYTLDALSSIIYEKTASIWFVFILQWCFSMDIDSKFFNQLFSYPVARWIFLLERAMFSVVIFFGLTVALTIPLAIIFGNFLWQAFMFTIPIYLALGGVVILGIVVGNHSLGGLIAGILFWMMILFGGSLLREYNAILLIFRNIEHFVSGESGFFLAGNRWIIFNRLFYIGLGVLCTVGAIFKINQNSV